MQQLLADMEYLIIDEMSIVGRKFLGQVDKLYVRYFPLELTCYLEVAHVYSLEILDNFLQ